MILRKTALSLFVIASSSAYVWSQSGGRPADDPLGAALTGASDDDLMQPAAVKAGAPLSAPTPRVPPAPAFSPPPLPQPEPDQHAAGHSLRSVTAVRAPVAAPTAVRQAPAPIPRPRPVYRELPANRLVTRAAMTVVSGARYTDGTYTGPAVDAYYGLIQIQAIVGNGQIVALKVLQYPSDRRTSVTINRQALPMLRDEVVSVQTANVDLVSGATLTSQAFIRSLDGALQQANGH